MMVASARVDSNKWLADNDVFIIGIVIYPTAELDLFRYLYSCDLKRIDFQRVSYFLFTKSL